MNQRIKLKRLIEGVVSQMLEQEEPVATDDSNDGIDLGEPASNNDEGGLDLDSVDSEAGSGGEGELGLDDTATDETGLEGDVDNIGSGGGGSGGLNLGSGGGSGADAFNTDSSKIDSAESEDEPGQEPTSLEPGETLIPDDPVQTVLDQAFELSQQTGDDQLILNTVKSSIQDYFSDFEEAAPVVQSLWQTEDPILRVVARKLLLFIKGN
jgi:hypothetical protein